MKTRQLFKTEPEKEQATKTFKAWKNNKNQNIEIFSADPTALFRKGNKILVDGLEMRVGKVQINDKEVKISNGRITEVTALNAKTPGTRKVFKPSGKKMTGTLVTKPAAEKKRPTEKPKVAKTTAEKKPIEKPTGKYPLLGNERMLYMRAKDGKK
jgi:hypothetical protein